MHNQDEEVHAGVFTNPAIPPQYRGLFVTPAARVELFPTTAVSPWISLGGGFGHIGEPKNLLYGGINPGKGKTFGVFEGGLGRDCKSLEEAEHPGRTSRFLVWRAGFSTSADGQGPPAQLFCR